MTAITIEKLTFAAVTLRTKARVIPNAGLNRIQLFGTVAEVELDTDPPVIGPETPTAPDFVDPDDEISVPVTGATETWIIVDFADGNTEVIFDPHDNAYADGYTGDHVADVYSFTRDAPGFYGDFTISVYARDDAGNEAADSYAYTAPDLPPVDGGDAFPPVVNNVSPTPGSTLQPTTPIQFDVTDLGTGLAQVLLTISFQGLAAPELAYDGTQFTPAYFFGSTVSVITNGFRFTLIRSGGWPAASFTLTAYPVDNRGNKA